MKKVHFLVTRFNVPAGWACTKSGGGVLSESWLNDRFDVFDKVCFPSIQNQTNKNFIWLVYFDTLTPLVFKEKINALKKKLVNFVPVYIGGMDDFLPSVKSEIQLRLNSAAERLITTRVDNDDALHKDFIELVQDVNGPLPPYLIQILDGYQMQLDGGLLISRIRKYFYNPFISLVELPENFITVWDRQHESWRGFSSVQIENKPFWLQVSHSNNLKITFISGPGTFRMCFSTDMLKDFGVKIQLKRFDLFKVRAIIFLPFFFFKRGARNAFYYFKNKNPFLKVS